MSDTRADLVGVGGWLAFLVIVLSVFTPFGLIVGPLLDLYADPEVALFYAPVWVTLQTVIWVTAFAGVALCYFLVYRLNRVENWTTVRLTIAGLWIIGVGTNAVHLAAVSLLADIPLDLLLAEGAVPFLRAIIFAIVWTSYLLLSRRVANTYRRGASSEELAGRFA